MPTDSRNTSDELGRSAARDRLVATASRLFYEEGVHSVGVDRILAEAGVTRATMYRHFRGKEDLVVAWLDGEDTTLRTLFADAQAVGGAPEELLRAVIDGIATDATRLHTRGCPFINAAAEYPDRDSAARHVITRHRQWFRNTLTELAAAAGLPHPRLAAAQLVLLRDAMLVGGYLDGDRVEEAFRSAALLVCGLGDN